MRDDRPIEVLAISGSIRSGSYNRQLLEAGCGLTPPGMTIRFYEQLRSVPPFDEDWERAPPTGPNPVSELRVRVANADGILISTPEYNQSIPGVLKNAIDWLSRPGPEEVLSGKPAAILGATPGRWGTRYAQKELRHVLAATEALVLPQPQLYVREVERMFDAKGHLTDAATADALRAFLLEFGRWVRRLLC